MSSNLHRPSPAALLAHASGSGDDRIHASAAGTSRPADDISLDGAWIARLLRYGFLIALAGILTDLAASARLAPPDSYVVQSDLVNAAAAFLALCYTYRPGFARRWKPVTFAFMVLLVSDWMITGAKMGQLITPFISTAVMLMATSALVPWEFLWQGVITIYSLSVASLAVAMVGRHVPNLPQVTFDLFATSLVALASNVVWTRWRTALARTNRRLREEIGEREAAQRRLEDGEANLRKLLDASLDQVSVIRLRDYRYVYVNEEFVKRGYARGELLGKTPLELGMFADEEQYGQLRQDFLNQGFVRNRDVDLRMRDGTVVPFLMTVVNVELGGEPCVLSIGREITELRKVQDDLIAVQRRLAQEEAKLRKIFEACPQTICINSLRDGRYIDINPTFSLTGYAREEMMARPVEGLKMWPERKRFLEFKQELVNRGIVRNMEVDFRMKDGTMRPCLISGAIVEIDGEPCAVTFTSDIARLKRTERELIVAREEALAASRAKSEFLSNMSHEIRTPMNAILGMADLLAEGTLTAEQRKFVETMTTNGNTLMELINGILDLARVESGKLRLEETEFDLVELVEHVAETLGPRANEKGLELCNRVMSDVPLQLVGDPLRLRQVLINLAGNAIKFTESGEVVLTIENDPGLHEPGRLRFSVRDTGVGIAPEKVDQIFQAFTQADSSTTRTYGGSGLGLTIARRLVELMGGKIWVASEVGKGSNFYFTAQLGLSKQPVVVLDNGPTLAGMRVLVVDDNATNRLALKELLVAQGVDVVEASGGSEALTEAARASNTHRPFRLTLIDSKMPNTDSFRIAEELMRKPAGSGAVVLMLTSDDLNLNLKRAREIGVNSCVIKPVKRSELFRAIAKLTCEPQPLPDEHSPILPEPKPPAVEQHLRILLAEDSPHNRMLIDAYLKNLPYDIDATENGAIAVEKFMSSRYDLVLMDMRMPVMDGYTAVRKIREWERNRGLTATPIVALTASALEDDVRNCLEAGCTTHLSKPVKKATLLDCIRDLAAKPASTTNSDAAGTTARDAAGT